ncbi:MAG: alpha/beta hydrolase [Thalassobaculales bacterium]
MPAFHFDVHGSRLRGQWWQPDPGRLPIVLLHEGLGSLTQWRDFPERLAAATAHPVFAFERRGHGGSSPLEAPRQPDYLEAEAAFLWPTLDAAGIGRAILLGHSDGGSIALLAAAAAPARVPALVTIAAHVFVEDKALAGIRAAQAAYPAGLRDRLMRHHGANTDAMFAAWADTWLAPGFRGWNVEERLAAITSPALVMQGAEDEYGTPDQVDAIGRHSGGFVWPCLLPGLRHQPHLEDPGRVLDEIAGFLAGTEGLR